MIEKILKDRLVSIEAYQEKLKKDTKKLSKFKKSEDETISKRAVELENSIREVLTFINTYKKELNQFLAQEVITSETYKEHLAHYDEKFFEVLKFIQKKEDALRTVTQ